MSQFMKKYTGQSYHNYLQDKKLFESEFVENRFVKFSQRDQSCDISQEAFDPLSDGKYATEWKGIPMVKCCMDLIVYQQIMWEVKPQTIIELGTAYGGSALWMSDIMASYDIPFHIYTVDIDKSLCDQRALAAKNVTFLQGDCNKIEETFTEEFLNKLPHPWFIIEDAHINVVGVMRHFHKHLLKGDYLIIEDTNPLAPAKLIQGYTAPGFKGVGRAKLEQVKEFMQDHDDEYVVDAKMQDMFGRNGSWNMNSTFLKI